MLVYSQHAEQRQAFLGKLHNLAARCSPEAPRNFREKLNQILDQHDASTEDRPAKEEAMGTGAVASAVPVFQSQVGTESLSPAALGKAADPGSASNTVNHPDKERTQGGVSAAPVSPSAVPAARPAQSQVGTRNLSPAVQVKAVDPGSAPKIVNHPKKERMQGGVSAAPVLPSVVPAAKPPQSQVGTGLPSQPKEAIGRVAQAMGQRW
jgi:hypothetical protein